ncbi:MAG: GTPase, partial [Candidatus Micrarchaeota archaeon]
LQPAIEPFLCRNFITLCMATSKIIDAAFRRANKAGSAMKSMPGAKKEGRKNVFADIERLKTARDYIIESLNRYVTLTSRPLGSFEKHIIETQMDRHDVSEEIEKVKRTITLVKKLGDEFYDKMKYVHDSNQSNMLRQAYYGRVASAVDRLKFKSIERYIHLISQLPEIKEMRTIIIAGYPNVGKSEIMKGLCGSKIETAIYPFTTKELLIGYMRDRYDTIQVIDTPGIFDRPFEKMNDIERKAFIALKYLSKDVLFILDPSETCGYAIEKQVNLMHSLRKEFEPKMLVVSTKRDLSDRQVESDIRINALDGGDIKLLKQEIAKFFRA